MKDTMDISYFSILISYSALVIPVLIFLYYKIRLIKSMLLSVLRMTVQLFFMALYLEYIFKWNNAWVNSAWVLIMVVVSAVSSIRHSNLKLKYFLLPILFSGFLSLLLTDAFFLGVVIKLEYLFETQYFVPISGMILGNILKYNIIGLTEYYSSIGRDQDLYYFLLVHNHPKKARVPFIRSAFKKAISPYIATISVIGLISLPGMMTGQILGGTSPVIAIKYQVLIVIGIFIACILNLYLSILFTNRSVFDAYGSIRKGIMRKEKKNK
ncbi:MAG: ABC transporter permease [Marinilabiliales bacterium]|nr:MAG: ABC transporter permease [Marinilabiliales bacterium]